MRFFALLFFASLTGQAFAQDKGNERFSQEIKPKVQKLYKSERPKSDKDIEAFFKQAEEQGKNLAEGCKPAKETPYTKPVS